jgi:hypothetical protein
MTLKEQEQRLLEYYRQLSPQDCHALLRFAAYLATNQGAPEAEMAAQAIASETAASIPQPQRTPRPQNERVVDALKRLSATYPMLEKKKLLDQSSTLVAQHIMFGKSAREVIDQIEKVFADAYAAFVREQGRS